jgi:hypothetical protein
MDRRKTLLQIEPVWERKRCPFCSPSPLPRLVPTPSRIRCDRNFHPPMQSFPAMFLQSDNRAPNPAVQPVIVSPQVEVKRFGSSVHYVRWKNPGNLWGGLGQTKLHRRQHSRTTNNQGDLSAEPETWRQRVGVAREAAYPSFEFARPRVGRHKLTNPLGVINRLASSDKSARHTPNSGMRRSLWTKYLQGSSFVCGNSSLGLQGWCAGRDYGFQNGSPKSPILLKCLHCAWDATLSRASCSSVNASPS